SILQGRGANCLAIQQWTSGYERKPISGYGHQPLPIALWIVGRRRLVEVRIEFWSEKNEFDASFCFGRDACKKLPIFPKPNSVAMHVRCDRDFDWFVHCC